MIFVACAIITKTQVIFIAYLRYYRDLISQLMQANLLYIDIININGTIWFC